MTQAITQVDEVKMNLNKMEGQFRMALPSHIPSERFLRVLHTAVGNNPGLLQGDRKSLFAASMQAAQDGLLPDGKEGALVMFGQKVQWMPMLAGILKKVRNSGELSSINAQVVYAKDEFKYYIDEDGEHLSHVPFLDGPRGDRRLTYAIARTKDGGVYVEVMTEDQIQAVKSVSRSKGSGPWAGPFEDEMRRKTALRRLSKRLPMSTDVERLIQSEDEDQEPQARETLHVPQEPQAQTEKATPKKLKQLIEATANKTEESPPAQAVASEEDVPL